MTVLFAAVVAVLAFAAAALIVSEVRLSRRRRAYTYRRDIDLTGVKPRKGGRRAA